MVSFDFQFILLSMKKNATFLCTVFIAEKLHYVGIKSRPAELIC